jgi:hypothetical protein
MTQLFFPYYLLYITFRRTEYGTAHPIHRHSADRWHLAKTEDSLGGAHCQQLICAGKCKKKKKKTEKKKKFLPCFINGYIGSIHRYILNIYIYIHRIYIRYVYRQVFGPKSGEITGNWSKFHIE